ncbi:MAG: hypothetical protein LUE08_00065 [Akkermansiaceae bacterium]|nr:hypothetical protein [Akkermansiaceae bacterium]
MPNQQSKEKKKVSFWLPRILYAKFSKRAKELDMPKSELIVAFMLSITKNTTLSENEYNKLIEEMRDKN